MFGAEIKDYFLVGVSSVISLIIGFALNAHFSDRFYLPFSGKRFRTFPEGRYKFYAPGRENKNSLIVWEVSVKKNLFFMGSYIHMFCTWIDSTYEQTNLKRSWEYQGPIIINGDFTMARLNVKRHRKSTINLNGETVRATTREDDPSFFILHKSTDSWTIRPAIITGFDAHDSCYGAVGLLTSASINLPEEVAKSLLGRECFLNYENTQSRVYNYLFPKPPQPTPAPTPTVAS